MKNVVKALLNYFFYVVIEYFKWILPYSKKIDKIPLEKRYAKVREILVFGNKKLKVDLHVEGKENILDNACYIANHLSAVDPIPYFAIFEKPLAFLGKIEIQKMPFAGKVFTIGGGLFLDRSDLKQQLKIMMKVQDSLKNKECSWMIFPEGTRNKDAMSVIPEFHPGTFRAAMKAKAPIVPVVNFGTERVANSKENFKSYPTIIKFLTPIMPEEYEGKTTDEVALIVHSRIQKALTFDVRVKEHEYMLKVDNGKYRFNKIY